MRTQGASLQGKLSSPLGPDLGLEVADVPLPTRHVRVLLGADVPLWQLCQLPGVRCRWSGASLEVAPGAEVLIEGFQVLDEGHSAGVRCLALGSTSLPGAAAAAGSLAGAAASRTAGIVDHRLAGLRVGDRILVLLALDVLHIKDLDITAKLLLQILQALPDQSQL